MAQKLLNGVHISGATRLDFMPTHESEGIITLGRYDSNTSRYHNIKSYVSSTEASNYLKFSLHNGTTNTVVDVLTLNGNKNATFAGDITTSGNIILAGASNEIIKSDGSIRLNIDSNNDQTDRVFIVSTGTNSELFKVEENGNGTFAGSGTFETTLNVSATDGGGSPAMTAIMNMHGYEGRGVGIKMKDSVNSASGPTNREWFVGTGYGSSGFNIGYASDGSQSSYAAQNKLAITTSGNATFAGTLQVDGSNVGIGGAAANASHGSVVTKLDMKGGADSIIILRGAAGGSGADAYVASEYGLYSYNGEFMLTRTNQSSWWTSPDLKLSGGNATFAGNVTCGQIDATSFTDVITNTIMTASGDLDIKTVLTARDIRFRSGSNDVQLRVKGDATGILINDHAGLRGVSATSATATTIVAEVKHALFSAAFFDFVIKNGTNVRAGTVYACHNGASTPLVEFAETSTVDLGDTSDVTLSVVISGNNMNLQAVTTSSTWAIKSLVRTI